MTRYRRAVPAVLLPLALAGCGGWAHPTKPPGEFAFDDARCEQEAMKQLGYVAHKEDAPKWFERAFGSKTYTIDGNENLRTRWHQTCLRLNGWTWRSKPSRPSVMDTDLFGSGHRYSSR